MESSLHRNGNPDHTKAAVHCNLLVHDLFSVNRLKCGPSKNACPKQIKIKIFNKIKMNKKSHFQIVWCSKVLPALESRTSVTNNFHTCLDELPISKTWYKSVTIRVSIRSPSDHVIMVTDPAIGEGNLATIVFKPSAGYEMIGDENSSIALTSK